MTKKIKLNPTEAKEFMKGIGFKKMPKWKRFLFAVKNAPPERLLTNKFWGQVGNCIGLFCAIIYLITVKVYWLLFFMPFIFYLSIISLIEIYQQLQQFQLLKIQMDAMKKGTGYIG